MATSSRSCPWSAAYRLADREPFLDRRPRLGPLVPRLGAARRPHGALVPLAGQQHGVTWTCDLDRPPNRGAPVDDDLEVATRSLALGARLHVAGDLSRVLAQRIVGGDDEKVRELGCGAAHPRAVVVGARGGAENGDEPPPRERSQLRQRDRE